MITGPLVAATEWANKAQTSANTRAMEEEIAFIVELQDGREDESATESGYTGELQGSSP